MNVNYYARYWHGYVAFLRPLLCVFSYTSIRYLYMFVHIFLFAACLLSFKAAFPASPCIAYLWTFAFAAIYPVIFPFSLQYSCVIFIMNGAVIYLLRKYKEYDAYFIAAAFLLIGMLTTFFDILTAPLLTFGVPLAVIFLRNINSAEGNAAKQNWLSLFVAGFSWCAGFFGFWFCKWVVGSPILRRNLFAESIEQGSMRLGSGVGIVYRLHTARDNFLDVLPPLNLKLLVLAVALLLVVYALLLVFFRASRKTVLACLPLLCLALVPSAWHFVFANHSSIHRFFTYRTEMITIFSLFAFVHQTVDWAKLGQRLKARKNHD